jgi:hypothetical protein
LNDVSIYHTRVRKATFLATDVHPSFIESEAAACDMYKYLTGIISLVNGARAKTMLFGWQK